MNEAPHDYMDDLIHNLWDFPLLGAVFGRRARRFALGMEMPNGPLAFRSRHAPIPLSELEQALLVSAATGVTGWNFGIPYSPGRDGEYSSYTLRLTGRTNPTAAGIGTPELFYTDDSGIYMTKLRDATPSRLREFEGINDTKRMLAFYRHHIVKLSDKRLDLPRESPHISPHNLWNANFPGSTLFFPVADVSQELLCILAIYLGNKGMLYDDIARRPAGNLDRYIRSGLIDEKKPALLSVLERDVLIFTAIEVATMGHNIVLLLQAMGLGGWMYTGVNPYSAMGAFAEQGVKGLGFRFVRHDTWPLPNPVGLDGHYEGSCPPYYPDMRDAVRKLAEKKFGQDGTYDPQTPGPFQNTDEVKGSVTPYSEEFIDCLGEMAQYVYDTYGKFPATVPTIFMRVCVQAQHIDTEFYDRYFKKGSYLDTHAEHMARWHGNEVMSDE
ncbi:MAG: hypothetical protein HY731_10855 [Candidatus Tectomicrobia bacterium]|nr:hypothetical protein [Candidatus Tectomicrobia bacterium]